MIRWLTGTLSRRLFLLMWAALVGSHVLAFAVVHAVHSPPHTMDGGPSEGLPTFPSLPPTPGVPGSPADRPPEGGNPPPRATPPEPKQKSLRGEAFNADPAQKNFSRPPPPRRPPPLPPATLALDYGIRLIVIAAAAWFGSLWLAAPMRKLVTASQSMGQAVAGDTPLPQLDERSGTVEVRETAKVFNTMAKQLREQFKGRELMMAAISHDLRTPLTRLRMRLENMTAEPDLQQRCVSDIREMNTLIDTVLQVFRSGALDSNEPLQLTDVEALVQSLCDDLTEQQQPVSFSGTKAVVRAHPAALRRVIGNLISNALRYGERADVSVTNDHSGVHVRIDDQGPGIPPAHLESVFQPFYRVDGSRARDSGGTGLGLYIARDLTQSQGGRLTLSARPEGGLRAEVVLPHR